MRLLGLRPVERIRGPSPKFDSDGDGDDDGDGDADADADGDPDPDANAGAGADAGEEDDSEYYQQYFPDFADVEILQLTGKGRDLIPRFTIFIYSPVCTIRDGGIERSRE